MNRAPFAENEWYHCYNRGVDKRIVFDTSRDYQRFIQALYLCNSTESVRIDELKEKSHEEILTQIRGEPLVAIGAYCLMPNHFHILLKQLIPNGVTKFMRKVGTSYTMYFNIKNERTGNLFMRPFRSKHIGDDRYFRRVADYIHLNPAELFETGWKEGRVKDFETLNKRIGEYFYSSFPDYRGSSRPERSILHPEAFDLLKEISLSPNIIKDAHQYYQETSAR